ncbi:MAG TPA: hypothetical protein VGR11_04620 [Solirubrobacteraceae bacterium]|nr:hypothetical protein [Solirubrobacteraceae bacterium]
MNATDTTTQPSAPVGTYTTWFRRAMWAGIIQDWALGIPAIFAPERVLKLTKQRPTGDPTWSAFAALLILLISLLYIPGAQDPHRYRKTAWLSVFARPPGVIFFFGLRRGTYPLFGIIDALLFLVQAPLLYLASREHPEGGR